MRTVLAWWLAGVLAPPVFVAMPIAVEVLADTEQPPAVSSGADHQAAWEPTLRVQVSHPLAAITQASDGGICAVPLSRADDGHWQVEAITPPDGVDP